MSHHIIHVNNVFYKYPDGKEVLKGITFDVTHGESVGVIGLNGAGKSTLLKQMVGLILPDTGSISIGEVPVLKSTLKTIRQKIGFVFQDSDDQLFMNTVYDDVAFGPRNYKLPEEEVLKRVDIALDTVGISHLKDRASYKLSGGEKKAVSIATVLSMLPDILILDEPSSALDPKARRRLINLLRDFKHSKVIASHDMDLIYDLCERTILLQNGKILFDGKTEVLFSSTEILDECGLEPPFILQACKNCPKKNQ